MLADAFPDENGWPTFESASAEIEWIEPTRFRPRRARRRSGAGLGRRPARNTRQASGSCIRSWWTKDRRLQGVGRALVAAFEAEARRRGGLTATLGTDDEFGQTSLAACGSLHGPAASHSGLARPRAAAPFLFYRKLGYVVTGLMPDANGRGRPDIYMSKAAVRSKARTAWVRRPAQRVSYRRSGCGECARHGAALARRFGRRECVHG